MKEWLRICLILCLFGFFREMRPNESFMIEFFSNGVWKNVTSEQVNREIYPFGTYSYLAQLCVVFLITDILRYKPIIFASSIAAICMYSLLLWTSSVEGIYAAQFFYGFYMASEVAYYTYIYAKVPKDKYQRVTGYTRASLLTGKFFAGFLAQILVSFNFMNVRELNLIALGTQILSFVVSLLLPAVGISLYMWKIDESHVESNEAVGTASTQKLEATKATFSWNRASKLLWSHFITSYSNRTVLIWSLWWAFSTAGYLQVIGYSQLLWQQIDPEKENFYNGGIDASLTLFGALSASLGGHVLRHSFQKYDFYLLTVASLLQGGLTLVAVFASNVWIAYAMYVLFGIVYNFMITLVSSFVAKFLSDDSFALIFGINTLIAIIVQTILSVIFVTETASLKLNPRDQFFVYSLFFFIIGVLFFFASIVKFFRKE